MAAGLPELDLLRKRVMAVVGHELRTPVTTLRGLADQLVSASPAEISGEIAPAMARLAARVERLLDDLLVAADLGTVMPVGRPRPASVAHALEVAWAEVGADGDTPALDGDADAMAVVPPGTLARILAPLLDNAVKYGEPPVVVRAERGTRDVVVTIASGGPVLSSIDLALAFEPFYRGEHAVTSGPGLGVGLAVCRTLTQQAGGRVERAARPEGGVVATLTLPGQ